MSDDKLTADRLARQKRREERMRLLASGPPSPCISVCQMDPMTGYCIGCTRTIDEIRDWIISNPDERHAILAKIAERRAKAAER
ncbi:DUF1289 domain-containing protein [Dongia rigui]|uniref:DUF1289 domain-containing protein n=1 Tax=Dongia rigui TaxID=940149 RepID=A0ABU5DX18_9PROT|nr:DUF1289 domain-containing protein [Dongia rigui]MDY0871856.1 DUF1289 domain-containing protein [Dongia rigui]